MIDRIDIGDKVQFKGDHTYSEYTVKYIGSGKSSIELVEFRHNFFPYDAVKLVKKCPYQDGDRIKLVAVYWHEESREFEEREIMGTVDDGGIKFDKRTFDYYVIPVYDLNHILYGDTFGCDCNCAFCEPDEEKIRDAKLEYLDDLTCAFEDAKKDYEDFEAQLKTMRKLLGVE